MALSEGNPAPPISLKDESGNPFSLSSLLGKSVVLYFYPKAGTGGCTRKAVEQVFTEEPDTTWWQRTMLHLVGPFVPEGQL